MEGVEMKQVTLAELVEMARNDKALEQKIVEASKKFGGGSYSEALKALASELGYELTLEEKIENLEELSDDALEDVAGGVKATAESENPFCEWIMEFFGYDTALCY